MSGVTNLCAPVHGNSLLSSLCVGFVLSCYNILNWQLNVQCRIVHPFRDRNDISSLNSCAIFSINSFHSPPFVSDPLKSLEMKWLLAILLVIPVQLACAFDVTTDVIFTLYSKPFLAQPNTVLSIYDSGVSITASPFNPSLPTRIIIPGSPTTGTTEVVNAIRDAYYNAGDFNVIGVKWDAAFTGGNTAVKTKAVGDAVGTLVQQLVQYKSANPATVTIIGHCAGCNTAGYAGRQFQLITSPSRMVGVIVGLDPLLVDTLLIRQLDVTDAAFVQTIQTGSNPVGIGRASYFPNAPLLTGLPGCGLLDAVCKQKRAYLYFASSLSNVFPAKSQAILLPPPDSYMGGLNIDTTASGGYTVKTTANPPYV